MSTAASPPASRALAPLRLIVMGGSGSDEGSVASALAGRLGLAYVDADRWPWPERVTPMLRSSSGVVMACQALTRADRDRIRSGTSSGLRFVFLDLAAAEATGCLWARHGPVMPPAQMDGRPAALECPEAGEADILTVAAGRPVHDIIDEISWRLATRSRTGAKRHG